MTSATFGRTVVGLALVLSATGCGWFRGAVNDSPALRWWLFSNWGAQRICPEMLKRGIPLKLVPGGSTIGRFFPEGCQTQVNDAAQTIGLSFQGSGYAWTPVAGRVGFRASAAVEYRMDFRLTEEEIYVWGLPNRVLQPTQFELGGVENRLVDWAAQGPLGYLGSTFGAQLAQSQLSSGFTVLHDDDGDDFALGLLMPPQRPLHPFEATDSTRLTFANETTELRLGQVDFLGPFEVADEDQALFFRFQNGGPQLDGLLLPKGTGDLWRQGLQLGQPLGPPPQLPVYSFPVPPGSSLQQVRVAPGQYYLVVDHSDRVGPTAPPWNPLGSVGLGVVTLSYTAELGEVDD